MDSVEPTTDEKDVTVDRRRLLAAIGGGLAAGLAGCSGVTSQEFAATPVRLPAAVREELGLAEVFTDSRTTTRERTVGGQDVGVTITDEFAGYGRSYSGPVVWSTPRPTLVERFTGAGREATPGSGSAINAVASDLDIGQSNPSYVEGDTPVSGDRITLVIPERARHDGEVRLEEMMALHHGDALPVDEVIPPRGTNNYLVDLPQVLPDRKFSPKSSGYEPDDRWVAGHEGHWMPDDASSLRCLVCLGEQSPESVFGIDVVCPECRIEDGETVSTEETIFFVPAPKENPEPDPGVMDAVEVFDAGYPTPIGGPTYGLGVIATPNAEIADESVNPLARMNSRDLLTSDRTEGVLADAGLTDADEVEWLRGPRQIPGQEWGDVAATVLGEEVGLELFGGVVSGKEGPWAAAVHVAKATDDDVVVPGAVHRRPVGTVDGRELFGDGGGLVDRQWTTRALELTQEVFASLEAATEEA